MKMEPFSYIIINGSKPHVVLFIRWNRVFSTFSNRFSSIDADSVNTEKFGECELERSSFIVSDLV